MTVIETATKLQKSGRWTGQAPFNLAVPRTLAVQFSKPKLCTLINALVHYGNLTFTVACCSHVSLGTLLAFGFRNWCRKGEQQEYQLYNQVKNSEYKRQKQEQGVRRLQNKLLEMRREHAAKLQSEMAECGTRGEKSRTETTAGAGWTS